MASPSLVFAGDDPLNAPPKNITPTTTTLGQLLKLHDAAVGRLTGSSDLIRTETWTFTDSGASGSIKIVRHGDDYHSIIQTGPFTQQYGQVNDTRWHSNENGVISDTTSTETHSFYMLRILEDASDPKNDAKLLGETQTPQPAYVVEVKRPGDKHPEWIFFDKKTALIIRTEEIYGKHRIISSYDGFQAVHGLTEATHVHDTYWTSALDDDYRRQSVSFSSTLNPAEFTKPNSAVSFTRIDHLVDLHAHVVDGTVVVRLTVNGRGLDFELSSGDSHSYIDSTVAKELNLPTFGQVTEVDGDPYPYETQIADATIGDLHVQNFALEALPFSYHADLETKVVGTLGYDFISQGLVTVDYVNGRVTASPNSGDAVVIDGAYELPVWFDDGKPFITTTIGTHETNNVLLDSSFDFAYVLGSFSQEYPEAVIDAENGKKHGHRIVPFADSGSYGQDLDVWLANVPEFHVGPMNFLDYKLFATNDYQEQGNHPIDAIVGAQLLQYFDVSYDFAHNRVLLKPNNFFKREFHTVK